MKIMNYSFRILASLLIAATAMTACSKEEPATDEPIEVQQEMQGYTMTIAATKDISTKALQEGSGELNASWDEGEEVIAMQKDSEGWKTLGTLKAAASTSGTTTLTGKFESAPNAGKDIVLFLHSSNLTYEYQSGTLESLKEKGDYAKETILNDDFTVDDTNKTVTIKEGTKVEFSALQAIVKFTFKDKKGNPLHVYSLTIHDNNGIMRSKTIRENGEKDYENSDITINLSPDEDGLYGPYVYVAFCNAWNESELVLTVHATEGEYKDYISYTYTKKSPNFEHGFFYDITVKMDKEINLNNIGNEYTAVDGDVLTGKTGYSQLRIADGATVTLRNVNVGTETSDNTKYAGITCEGDATIILEGENTVTGCQTGYAAIFVPEGKTLTIKGDGKLEATGEYGGAGIGGNSQSAAGNIVIEGGTVTANGGHFAAGIGCGEHGTCGDITISNNVTKVTATIDEDTIVRGDDGEYSRELSAFVIGKGYGSDSACGKVTFGGVEKDLFTNYRYIYPPES